MLVSEGILAQSPCPLPSIVTDPNAAVNTERPDQANVTNIPLNRVKFDWTLPLFSYYNQNTEVVKSTIQGKGIPNLFYDGNWDQNLSPLLYNATSNPNPDFQWKDGWELIKQDFGFLDDGVAINPVGAPSPYIILYNRYSATLRVISSFEHLNAQNIENIKVTLGFVDPDPTMTNFANLSTSGLLNNASDSALALDQPTLTTKVSAFAKYNGDQRFFYADFHLGYDPCTCLFESGLVVEFESYNTGSITMYGHLLASTNPLNTDSDPNTLVNSGYLTSVYEMNAQDAISNAGILTYNNINTLQADFTTEANQIADEKSKAKLLSGISTVFQLGALVAGPETAIAFESVAGVCSFFAGKMDQEIPPPPSVIHGEMTFTGTMTDARSITGADILISNPGSKNSSLKPSYDNDFTSEDNLTYPTYNLPLGVFGLLTTPTADLYQVAIPESNPYGDSWFAVRNIYRLSSPLQYVFNPSLDIDYSLTTVRGALVVESYPQKIYNPNFGTTDASRNHYAVQSPAKYYHNLTLIKQYKDPNNYINKEVFIGNFTDLTTLSTEISSLEYTRAYWEPADAPVNLFIRLVVNVVYKSTNSSNGKRNFSTFILTYPLKQNRTNQDLSGIPISPWYSNNTPGLDCERALTIGSMVISSSSVNPGTMNGWFINGSSVTVTSWENITINGNLSLGSGVSNVTISSVQDVIQDVESTISGEFILQTVTTNIPSVTPQLIQNSTLVNNFCNGTASGMNPYKANTSLKNLNAIAKSSAEPTLVAQEMDLTVYPNPAADNGTIRYSIPQGGDVKLYLTNILGQVITTIQTTYQSKGNYQVELPAYKLDEGIYFCVLEAGGKLLTKKIVVVK